MASILTGVCTITLDDKWDLESGRVMINGSQAIARLMFDQAGRDRAHGLSTAGYITGYRGSPLGNVDSTLWTLAPRLEAAHIHFQPGLNEDIAATAIRGTQQIDSVPGKRYDGVFAIWYSKGPGVDRAGDALKHGNYAGSHPNGGVLLFYGDDHAGKSSTVSHQSEQALASNLIPSLHPADVGEILSFGLLGIAMSRYSGSWIAIKCVNEVAEQTATIDLDRAHPAIVIPADSNEGVHLKEGALNPLADERMVVERRLPLVHAFIRANAIDRVTLQASTRKLGIVTAGKTHGDVWSALRLLGLDAAAANAMGISVYKVGCIWPVEPQGLGAFAADHAMLLVVEDKKSFIEQQAAAQLINLPARPLVVGKVDERGGQLLSSTVPLDPSVIASAIAGRLEHLGLLDKPMRERCEGLHAAQPADASVPGRVPYFCSGCPHNRSTRIPEGSVSLTGIGCHTMVNFVRPEEALLPTQMGGEGGNWIGLAPFTDTPHVFQNMGDGTYFHSGLLAIRAAIAAGTNITYKILYNDAVAMTGGQPVDGTISVARIANQVRAEGVERIVLLSDDPARHNGQRDYPAGIEIHHRDRLDEVQRDLRKTPGCSVLVFEQTCAAEKRRRRKRGTFPDPAKRLFIAPEVCEGCGDCSVQSTCVSLTPIDTAFGRKRAIDQSSCNKDYSCLNGFCPSFLTIEGAELRKPEAIGFEAALVAALPEPARASVERPCNIMIAGIGGTGVVTVGALLGMAAHLDGLAMSLFDMTGLSQKNGAVFSHVRIAAAPYDIEAQRVGRHEADVVLAFDVVAALAIEALDTVAVGRTRVLANAEVTPTVAFQFDRDVAFDPAFLLARLRRAAGRDGVTPIPATAIATAVMGDSLATNLIMLGVAAQHGLLPVSIAAIRRAVELNRVAVPFNLQAFDLGRLFAARPDVVEALASSAAPAAPTLPRTFDEIVAHRADHLRAYQGEALAARFGDLVERVRQSEQRVAPGSDRLAIAAAKGYAKLLAYKDEYEVARLITRPELHAGLAKTFAPGARVSLNLAPPILGGEPVNGRPRKRQFSGWWALPLLRVLARLRFLRGTAADPFGYTAERRLERSLISEFESLLERLLAALTAGNRDAAAAIIELVDAIRGYGPVKNAAVEAYRAKLVEAEQHFAQAAAEPVPALSAA